MYLLLVIAAILFSVQFMFHQKFQQTRGDGADTSLLFQLNVGIVISLLMFIMNQFRIRVTLFSLVLAFALSLVILSYMYFSMKAFKSADLAVYSIFAMLGGMLLPFVYGTVFCKEGITVGKALGCILIVCSLMLTYEKGNKGKKCWQYYIAVFFFNGMMGVINKIHQSNSAHCTDSNSFLAMAYICVCVISLIWYLTRNKSITWIKPKEFTLTLGYGICNGIAELLCLIALTRLAASVQYPMITGGTILFSAIVSAVVEKQRSIKSICSALIALIASIIIIL